MKKVCKVVFNSVSHDARVIKEAEALAQSGYAVTIIGIQDANNYVPAEILDNGVVIRRAGWHARAFKPFFILYLWRFLATLLLAAFAIWGINWLVRRIPAWWGTQWAVDWWTVLFVSSLILFAAILIFSGHFIFSDYLRRKRSQLNLKKKENEALLRYDAVLSAAMSRGRVECPAPFKVLQTVGRDLDAATPFVPDSGMKPKPIKWRSRLPRPLMGGFRNAVRPANFKKWKVIYAREHSVLDLLREERPDIVHAHDISALPVCISYKKTGGIKLVFDAHEIYDHLAQAEDDMAELNASIMQKCAGQVDLFITINDSIGRYYAGNYPWFPKAIIVKNATIKMEEFDYDGRLHEAASLPRERRILLYQGGFAAKRGLAPLLLSAEHLSPEWSLVFMGWGKFEDELRYLAEALKIRTRSSQDPVIFVPKVKQKELPYWTAGAAVGVIPYENTSLNHWYCTPNKLWEYPNANVPILVSPFPEMRAVIERFGVGWLLPDPLTPSGIAAVVNQLSAEDIAAARDNCRPYVAADSWSVHARRLTAAYGECK